MIFKRKKQIIASGLSLLFACASLGLAGCAYRIGDLFSANSQSSSHTSSELSTPTVISFGNFLSWTEIDNATAYDVYQDGVLTDSVSESRYFIEDSLNKDCAFYIIARNDEGTKQSEKSNAVTVYKSSSFSDTEILDLSGKSNYSGTIPSSIRKVIIGKESSSSFSMSAILSKRSSDITFELQNVTITGSICTADESYSRTTYNYNVIMNVSGSCSIYGAKGNTGANYSDSIYNNQEKNAGAGGNGGTACIVPTLVVNGTGDLLLKGGNGGNGGVGSGTTGWSTSVPGKGSNGGDGGAGIKTSYLVVNMALGSVVSVRDGTGGTKGTPGVNGSVLSGPIASAVWSSTYDIGVTGNDGKSVIGQRMIIQGGLEV